MARPPRYNVDYFPFLCSEGETVYCIEQKYGNDGYATWIKILRQLAVTDYHYLNLSKHSSMMFLAAKCKISTELLIEIIKDLVEFGDFDRELWEQNKIVFCAKFIDSIEDAYIKRNNKVLRKQGLLHLLLGLGVSITPQNGDKGSGNPQSKVKKNKVEESKEENSSFEIYPTFNDFWDLYDKKVDRELSQKKWEKLTQAEKEKTIIHIEHYKQLQPDSKYRKNPSTYLNQKTFNDPIEPISQNSTKQSNSKNGTWLDFAREVIHDRQTNSGGESPSQDSTI